LAIEEVGGEQKTVFWKEFPEGPRNGVSKACEFRREGGSSSFRRGDVEGIERGFAMETAVVIDMALGEGSAKPAQQRTTAGIGGQGGAALAIKLAQSVKLRVQRVGQLVAKGSGSSDGNGRLGERRTVEVNEPLPSDLTPEDAGVGKSKLRETERTEESGLLGSIGICLGRKTVVELCTYGGKNRCELFRSEAALLSRRSKPKLLDHTYRKPRRNRQRTRPWRGFLRRGQWQKNISGLRRGCVHDLEDTASTSPCEPELRN